MKGLKKLAELSQTERVQVFYDILKDTVYSTPGENRFYLTDLINPNTEKDIEETVKYIMSL